MDLSARTIACALSVAIAIFSGCKKDDFEVKVDFEKRVLANGVTLLFVEDHTIPVVSYQTWVKVGSVDETPGKTGLAHLFEHLMFPESFVSKLESLGAFSNAFTTRDYTVFYENFHPKFLETILDLESHRFSSARFDETTLATEKSIVLEERRLRIENSPHAKAEEALWALSFQQHPYRNPVSGFPSEVLSLTVEDLNRFYSDHYHGGNIVVVVAGDFNRTRIEPRLVSAYSKLRAGKKAPPAPPREPEQNGERIFDLPVSQGSRKIYTSYPVTSAMESDTYALDVLAELIDRRSEHELVRERPVFLSTAAVAFTPKHPGLFFFTGTLRNGVSFEEAMQEWDALLKKIAAAEIRPADLEGAVKKLTLQLISPMRTPYGAGQFLGLVETFFGDPMRARAETEKYWKVTSSQVKDVLRRYLHPNRRNIVRMMPATQIQPARRGDTGSGS